MIHDENPFVDAPDRRDPVRRFRGRLTAPVTIVTSGPPQARTGLTVSSLMVIEGSPGRVQLVVGPTSDLWDTMENSGKFVIHICGGDNRAAAGVFAGLRPSPGGIFAGLEVSDSDWGPVIASLPNRAYCTLEDRRPVANSGIASGKIDLVEAAALTDPLAYFRGNYRTLD